MFRNLPNGDDILMTVARKGEDENENLYLGLALGLLWQHSGMEARAQYAHVQTLPLMQN